MDLTKARALIAAAIAACEAVTPPPSPPSAAMPFLDLDFGAATGLLPWAGAQTFKRGAVPAGAQVVANCAAFQCVPWSFHDDGSVRDAHIAVYCNVVVPGQVRVTMSLGTPAVAPDVTAGFADVQVEVDGITPAVSKRTRIAAGPVMYHEQITIAIDARLRVVYEVRYFKWGEREVLTPCIENTGFLAVEQPNRLVTATVRVAGAVRFSEMVDVKHHTRIPLLRGSTWSYWIGTNGGARPSHDRAYLCASESFPPYAPVAATLGNLRQTYAPNYVGEDGAAMASGGYGPHIGLLARHNIFPLTTGGLVAWNYMHAEAFAVGSWPVHFQDESTGALPLPSAYPTHTWQSNIPRGSGGENGAPDLAHQPSSVYTAAKLTGWRWFIDEHLAWVVYNHFYQQPPVRQNAKGILRTDAGTNQDRGAAWALRSLAQAIALCPVDHPLLPELQAIWQNNVAYYRARFVDGTLDSGAHRNNLGIMAPYSSSGTSLYAGGDRGTSTAWWGAAWMQSFLTQTFGQAIQLALPVSAQAQADARLIFEYSTKLIVGLCGPGAAGTFNWRRFGLYAMPFWPDGNQRTPGTWYPDFGQVLAEYERAKGLAPLNPAPGGDIKRHSTDTPVDGLYWQTGMVSYHWPALVYAVMHNASGAGEAFARVQSSSSWPLLAAGIQNPIWTGMMPPGVRHPGA